MKKRIFTISMLSMCLTFTAWSQTGERYLLEYGKQYVFRVVGDESKVIAYYEGEGNFTVEPYVQGNTNQLFQLDSFLDNEEAYMNFSVIANDYTWDDHGRPAKPNPKPTPSAQDTWFAWDLELNEDGNIRFCHFLERWAWTATWEPQYKGVFMFLSGTDVSPMEYARCYTSGVRDHSEYEAMEGELFDFKVDVVGGTGIQDGIASNVNAFGRDKAVYLCNAENLNVVIYGVDGKVIKQLKSETASLKIDVPQAGIYFVKAGEQVIKVAVK